MTKDQDRLYREVGQKIREIREQKGMTQAKLAETVSLTRTSITNVERGRQKLFVHTLFDIAAALGTEPSELLSQVGKSSQEAEPDVPADIRAKNRALIEAAIKTPKGR